MSTASTQPQSSEQTRLGTAIRRAQNQLLAQQHLDGYWWAELEANVTLTAEYVMLHRILGIAKEKRIQQARRYLLREQREHGSRDGDLRLDPAAPEARLSGRVLRADASRRAGGARVRP